MTYLHHILTELFFKTNFTPLPFVLSPCPETVFKDDSITKQLDWHVDVIGQTYGPDGAQKPFIAELAVHYETRVLAVVTELIQTGSKTHAHACSKGYECCAKYGSSKCKLIRHDKRFTELLFCYRDYNTWKSIKIKIFRRVRTTAKSDYYPHHVCLSVRLPARNNTATTGRIFMKFDIWGFFDNLSRKFKLH
jgi:hypothetical protein